jgi:hypothetical protein
VIQDAVDDLGVSWESAWFAIARSSGPSTHLARGRHPRRGGTHEGVALFLRWMVGHVHDGGSEHHALAASRPIARSTREGVLAWTTVSVLASSYGEESGTV